MAMAYQQHCNTKRYLPELAGYVCYIRVHEVQQIGPDNYPDNEHSDQAGQPELSEQAIRLYPGMIISAKLYDNDRSPYVYVHMPTF